MVRHAGLGVLFAGLLVAGPWAARGTPARAQLAAPVPTVDLFFRAVSLNPAVGDAALSEIAAGWKSGYAGMILDQAEMMRRGALGNPLGLVRYERLMQFLAQQTGQRFGDSLAQWRDWLWNQPYDPHPGYGAFKGALYAPIDPRFEDFFKEPLKTSIRLDQVDWGGVTVNGIPPLKSPKHIPASAATYLQDSNIVFGVDQGGEARAYPKRILAWHELALDRVGGTDITLVYCTLCGTVIPYNSRVGGMTYTFGTSGLLYNSNKLMFDRETHSLWSSLDGTPVIGPLVGTGLHLSLLSVVTTTWGEWRRQHPETTVLSLDTGYTRDYSEGAAYHDYFATDRLMFQVAKFDDRLRNKDEVLVPRPAGAVGAKPLAIAARFLQAHRVYQVPAANPPLVVVTTAAGANRVYAAGSHVFTAGADDDHVVDADGHQWVVTESQLQSAPDPSLVLPRVPAHRSFWFAWFAQHPDSQLIQ